MQAVLSARARLHATFNVAEVKSVGGYFPNLRRSLLDFAQDPETDIPDWLHSGDPLRTESTIGTNSSFLEIDGANTAVEASRSCGVAYGARWDPTIPPQQQVERLLSWPSWEAIRLRWPRAVATRPSGIAKIKKRWVGQNPTRH